MKREKVEPVQKMILDNDDNCNLFKSYSLLINDQVNLNIEDMHKSVWISVRNEVTKEDAVHLEIDKKSNFWKGLVLAINACNDSEAK